MLHWLSVVTTTPTAYSLQPTASGLPPPALRAQPALGIEKIDSSDLAETGYHDGAQTILTCFTLSRLTDVLSLLMGTEMRLRRRR